MTVLVIGFTNGGAINQRVMERVLEGIEGVDVYIYDVIIGNKPDTLEEELYFYEKKVREGL